MSLWNIIIGLWCIVLFVISGFVIAEYRFFHEQTNHLEVLKDEYGQTLTVLKKLIAEYSEQKIDESDLQDPKKKNHDDGSSQFLIVNREPDYLRESALSFARKHNIEWALRKMYEADEWVEATSDRSKKRPRKRPGRTRFVKNKSLSGKRTVIEQLKKMQREPIFKCPIQGAFYISSPFGPRKKTDGSWGFHRGLDLAAVRGTPVIAPLEGTVIEAQLHPKFGKTVVLRHDNKFQTRYAHLSEIQVHLWQNVKEGEVIGKVGATGNVRKRPGGSGDHLHFEVKVYGKQVNPCYFLDW